MASPMIQLVGTGPQYLLSSDSPRLTAGIGEPSPIPAVVGFATVVPHHEPVTGRNLDRRPEVACWARAAGPYVRILLTYAVADHVSFYDRDRVTGPGDDPLDEIDAIVGLRHRFRTGGPLREVDIVRRRSADTLLGALRGMENCDRANVGVAEVRADTIDQDALADRQCRFHRATGDAVGLDDERLDAERETERNQNDHDQLHDRASSRPDERSQAQPGRPRALATVFTPTGRWRDRLPARPPNLRGHRPQARPETHLRWHSRRCGSLRAPHPQQRRPAHSPQPQRPAHLSRRRCPAQRCPAQRCPAQWRPAQLPP